MTAEQQRWDQLRARAQAYLPTDFARQVVHRAQSHVSDAREYKACDARLIAFDQEFHSCGITISAFRDQTNGQTFFKSFQLTALACHQDTMVRHPGPWTKRLRTLCRLRRKSIQAANCSLDGGPEDYPIIEYQMTH